MSLVIDPAQALAADPTLNAFVTANAGSGKTKTLIDRVARLLLAGAPPSAILCVTYTKAAAAEMQARLFDLLGGWAVTPDEDLAKAMARLLGPDNSQELPEARRLFARALETPGGLKIQTIHAFCEQLLRRFPLEAEVSPGFTVMDDAAAALVVRDARARLAGLAGGEDVAVSEAYARLAIALDYLSFEGLFRTFEERRGAIGDYLSSVGGLDGATADVWARCGFLDGPTSVSEVERLAVADTDLALWKTAAGVLGQGTKTDIANAEKMLAVVLDPSLAGMLGCLFTQGGAGTPATWVAKTSGLKSREDLREAMLAEQERLALARDLKRGAIIAEDTLAVLCLAERYAEAYAMAKAERGVLDFADLVARARDLVARSPGAPWVLYKLDGGLEHILIDEAQDTAPEQWAIAESLTNEFFAGAGRVRPAGSPERTLFIVGDEKQSIYSFQGADPDRLLSETQRYIKLIRDAGRRAEPAPLTTSYRSVQTVLTFVDSLFSDPRTHIGVRAPMGMAALEHTASRQAQPGCVDLWPLEMEEPAQEREAWDAPLDVESEGSANRRLARRIAREIRELVDRGDTVFARDGTARAAGFGDIIILVRRRRALFEDIIRELRKAGVPVAGADRLVLSDHIAFDDLLALARFVQFPNDDLNLAALLKSPLCGVNDDDLYAVGKPRGKAALWTAVQASDLPARDWLLQALELAKGRPPFEFYSRMLSLKDAAGRSGRARMLERLGSEAGDVLDEFLARTMEAEQRGVLDLERLAAAFEGLEISVKREMEAGGGEVRVMTAHGAKGLEAPIVFLPETTVKTGARGSALLETGDGGFLWAPRQAEDCAASGEARQRRKDKDEGESWRLLYVALTRARDRLVLCGRAPARMKEGAVPEGWYGAMAAAFEHEAVAGKVNSVTAADGFTFQRFGDAPAPFTGERAVSQGVAPEPAAWLAEAAREEPPATAWASPSQAASRSRIPAPSPLSRQGGVDRFRRGDVIHRLLQLLPDVPEAERRETAARLLAREPDLNDDQRAEMIGAAMGVLEHPDFSEVFGPGSRAEVALAGSAKALPAGLAISGRVDRLVITPGRVTVIDYKTNRPAPADISAADPTYVAQLAIYAAVLGEVFPGRQVRAALVWTDGPKLMPVPEKMIAEALAGLPGAR
ncbi:double-strand break repair helicase AddA [Caulobacter sp. NIBR1757]|uniref:double-strand break repair helicase AddA n=1 Tax=Caulobacter sp. NIBR1757 TaxID=3016000 RepID=UPI0022EFF46C|nr:double-strand break repair helicase AddA [Caulobacter sp. NIBR1757]WGM37143.1 ATP-dependent helicase/nuclease subunit A [Caulobacter sp. NIBR1757]